MCFSCCCTALHRLVTFMQLSCNKNNNKRLRGNSPCKTKCESHQTGESVNCVWLVRCAYTAHGTNLQLAFPGCATGFSNEYCDFNKQPGRVYIRSSFIMNGVCVRWKGWLDLHKLEGMGCLEFDEERAKIEDAHLREQIEKHREKAFDSFRVDNPNPFPVHSKRSYRERIQGETDLSAHHIDVHRT
ncbi:protein big brother-like isoform X2 [Varroa jacobsoni]|uniref:protein big brother-like isoform X2 n=1 Tax=Varroa jacobsoni TaxID=62625 RepID=UPI000BF63B1B|nr:protein big brother-like isoform X2 [Varroa jacobsoni]